MYVVHQYTVGGESNELKIDLCRRQVRTETKAGFVLRAVPLGLLGVSKRVPRPPYRRRCEAAVRSFRQHCYYGPALFVRG